MNIDEALYKLKREFTKKRALALFVLFVSSLGFISAARFGGASLDYYSVKNMLALWRAEPASLSREQYEQANEAIADAEFLHASHPLYDDLAGQLKEWGYVSGFDDDALEKAKAHYLQAVKLRPAWPVTWANLAMIKWRKQEFDDELLSYLNNADQLGKIKPEVHIVFAEMGLALYSSNHPFYKNINQQTKQRVVAGVRNEFSRDRVLQAIERYEAKDFACIWSADLDEYVYNHILECEA